MTANIHAENMRLYALDAAETERPYTRWEVCNHPGLGQWLNLNTHPSWENGVEYRRKPKPFTVRINGGAETPFATALRRAPAADATVHIINFSTQEAAFAIESEKWNHVLAPYLKGGLCFDTLEGAEAMRDILNMIVSTT
jgi:hypothetical protein